MNTHLLNPQNWHATYPMDAMNASTEALQEFVRAYQLDLHLPTILQELAAINPERPRATDARRLAGIRQQLTRFARFHQEYPFVVAPPGTITGDILLGYQLANKLPVTIAEHDLTRHGGLFGSSGCGKTTFAFNVMRQVLGLGKKVFILDPKDDSYHVAINHRDFLVLSPHAKINLLQLPSFLELNEFLNVFTKVWGAVWYAGENQKQVLDAALVTAFNEHETPCLADVKTIVDKMYSPKLTYQRKDAITGVSNRFERFGRTYPGPFNTRHGITYEELFKHSLYMNALLIDEHTTFLYTLLVHLLYLHNRRSGVRDVLDYLLVNDEGNQFWNVHQTNIGEAPTLVNLQGMIRESGIGLLHTSVDEASLHPILMSNTHLHVAMNVASGREELEAVQNLGLSEEQHAFMRKRLRRGQCIIRINSSSWKEPILCSFPYTKQNKQVPQAARNEAEQRINRYAPPELPASVQTNQEARAGSKSSTEPAQSPTPPARPHSGTSSPQNGPESPPSPSPAESGEACSSRPGVSKETYSKSSDARRQDGTLPFPDEDEERRPPTKLTAKEEILLRTCTERLWVATEAYEHAGIARQAGQTAKTRLVKLGLLTESKILVRPGRGGNALLLEPTTDGYELLGRQAPKGTRGGDSAQHRWLVQELAACIPDSVVEFTLGGKSMDLFLRYKSSLHERISFHMEEKPAPDAHLAIEVECNPGKTAINNIIQNREVGIAHTIVAVLPKHVATTKTGLAKKVPKQLKNAYSVVDVFELLEEVKQ